MRGADFWKDKRVLVLGHTGFKGSWLSLWLQLKGARVFGLSLPPGDRRELFEGASSAIEEEILGDTRDRALVEGAFERVRPEIVFHLAAQPLVHLSYRDPVGTFATNVMGTVHVLSAAAATASVGSLIVVTSDKCYENREWLWAYREDEALGGHDPYSASKACAELVTAAWRRSFCRSGTGRMLGIASARAGNVIGGGDWAENRLIPDCMRALLGGQPIGIQIRTRRGHGSMCSTCSPAIYGEAWNFGPDDSEVQPVSWIASRVVERWGGDAHWEVIGSNQGHEASYLKLDASKARARLGWRLRLPLQASVDWSVDWYTAFAGGAPARQLMSDQIARFETL